MTTHVIHGVKVIGENVCEEKNVNSKGFLSIVKTMINMSKELSSVRRGFYSFK